MENELFEKAPCRVAYFTMALPVVMGMVVSLIYNMVDTFFIARTQNTNLVAGVSPVCADLYTDDCTGRYFWPWRELCDLQAVRREAERRGKEGQWLLLLRRNLMRGVAVTLLMLFLQMPILRKLLGATEDTMEYARQYYQYMGIWCALLSLSR